jgi:small subunit ribosomal protein S4
MKIKTSTKKFKALSRLGFNINDHPKILHDKMKKKKWVRFKNALPRKTTEYGALLLAKQRLKYFYGNITERNILNLYKKGKNLRGNNGVNFLKQLEKRLDTVLFRSRFSNSFEDIRQLIAHGHICVNGKVVKTSSFVIEPGDCISVKPTSYLMVFKKVLKSLEIYLNITDNTSPSEDSIFQNKFKLLNQPDYLEVNLNILECIFISNPSIEQLTYPFPLDLKRIIQYYEFQRKI